MFTHWMEIVHIDDNGYRYWLFYWNVSPQKESTSKMSVNGKGFTLKGLFRSPFTELFSIFFPILFKFSNRS